MRQEVAHWAKEQMRQQLTGQTSAQSTRPQSTGLSLAHEHTVRTTLHLINLTEGALCNQTSRRAYRQSIIYTPSLN